MKITDLITKESIRLDGKPSTKEEALDAMIELMAVSGNITDIEEYRRGVYAREEESTTGIGEGIAIPHAKSAAVKRPGLAAMIVKDGVEFEALDEAPVHLIFLIAAPNTKENVHLEVLSRLSVLLMNEEFTEKLKQAKTKEEFLALIDEAEAEREKEESHIPDMPKRMLAAVTSCPTGIAHTYMASESLQKRAAELGIEIKVETRGSGGAKNVLSREDIERAECIIVAADTQVPMERFDGKHVIQCKVADGISRAEELIERSLQGKTLVYHAERSATEHEDTETEGKENIGHMIYKHLMNGVSHMLPFVVGGGILIAIAFLIDGFSVDLETASEAVKANFGTITPLAAFSKGIGDVAFGFMLPILAGYIAMSIADRPGLALGFVGGGIAANGTSGFLGALAAGFLAGYTLLFLKRLFDKLPDSLEGIKPVLLYPLCGILIVGIIMRFVIEPPVGWLNELLNAGLTSMSGTSKILLGIIVAGMMAVDLGGPVNKAAYVFGVASIAEGNYDVMAAVMVGGMVPPCAIALATLLFKNKFTKEERKSGSTNFIMGLAFISEGAIPYAAADPLHVIPSCIVGSAVAGALSMIFDCTLMAPHGGIFVFPVVGNALLYLASLVAGTATGAIMLGVLKKTRTE